MNKITTRVTNLFRNEKVMLSIVVILAFILRLYKINNPIADWHSWRQADTASVSKVYIEEGIDILFPRYHDISTTQTRMFNPQGYRFVEFPIYNLVHSISFNVFPYFSIEVWGRLISVLAALVTTFFLYLIGKRYLGTSGGILAAAFYGLIPYNVYFTRMILPEPLATMLVVVSLWFFIKFTDIDKTALLYLSAVFFSLALLVKPFIIFYSIPILYLGIKKYGFRGIFENRFKTALIITVAPLILWRLWINQYPEGIPLWKWAFNGDGIRFRPSFFRWIFGERLGKLMLGFWGLIPFVFGLVNYSKKREIVHVIIASMLLYVTVIASANVKHDYYQTITVPAISLVLASGTLTMWRIKDFSKKITRGILIFSIGMLISVGAYQVRGFYKINRPEIIEAGNAVDEITPKDSLVIAPYNGDTAFLYQTNRWGWPVVDRPIDELIEKGASYFVSVDLNHHQTIEFSERFKVLVKTEKYIILDLNTES